VQCFNWWSLVPEQDEKAKPTELANDMGLALIKCPNNNNNETVLEDLEEAESSQIAGRGRKSRASMVAIMGSLPIQIQTWKVTLNCIVIMWVIFAFSRLTFRKTDLHTQCR
jgi:hypothetical protein